MSMGVPDTAFLGSAMDLLSKTHLEVLQVQEVKICSLLKIVAQRFSSKVQSKQGTRTPCLPGW